MRFPPVLFALPLLAAGILAPALGTTLAEPEPHVVGMGHEGFLVDGQEREGVAEIEIRAGEMLTFQNNSRWIHVLAAGRDGMVGPAGDGAMQSRFMLQQDESYTTTPWSTPGTYPITCPVHPDMNAVVVVQP